MRSMMDTRLTPPYAARAIGVATLGREPGPMAVVESSSHCVYVSPGVVVKIINAGPHSRLDREIALAPHLPARLPGTAPGMGMPGVDGVTARLLAEDAVQRPDGLHRWIPAGHAEQTLREPLDHGGFVSQAALLAARAVVPVHADCHWRNWLACDQRVTALPDFEWVRFGEPVDDWFFLIRFSGPHQETVLDHIACATTISRESLRAQCEVRDATYLASDLRVALEHPDACAGMRAERLRALEELIVGRYWWRRR